MSEIEFKHYQFQDMQNLVDVLIGLIIYLTEAGELICSFQEGGVKICQGALQLKQQSEKADVCLELLILLSRIIKMTQLAEKSAL